MKGGGFLIGYGPYPRFIQLVDPAVWVGEQDGGMGGDNKLAALFRKLMQTGEHRHLPQRGQSCLRFVEQIQAVPPQAVLEQGKKAFAVGTFVEAAAICEAKG